MKPRKIVRCSSAKFREICAEVKAKCPPPSGCNVVFRRCSAEHLELAWGVTEKIRREFTVKVRSDMTEEETEDTVIHEYAHVTSWRPYHPVTSDHDAAWGVAYAEVYRAYHGTR